jgi:putative FmdB family regulatory protein
VPTYQYACTSCGEQVEAVQKFTDDPLTVCTACGGTLRKVYSAVGIVFKGSGFYRTDSRKASVATEDAGSKAAKSNGSSGEGSSEGKKDSPASGSSDTKPDGKKSGSEKASQPASSSSGSGSGS